MVPDQIAALDIVVNLGFDRILTSGGKPGVLQGSSRLKELVDKVTLSTKRRCIGQCKTLQTSERPLLDCHIAYSHKE